MDQMSFGDGEYAGKKKRTRREVFLTEMEQVVPWDTLLSRQPYPLATMLRVHLMQTWFGLSDPAMEEALYEIASMRQFARLPLTKAIPDETTILNVRHRLEQNELAPEIFARINAHLQRKGLMVKRGSIVDATIISAPISTKNAERERAPEASDEEGQPVVLRDEGAHRGGCRLGSGAHGGGDAGERGRCRGG